MSTTPLLQVRDLRTHFMTRAGQVPAVDGVSLQLESGRILGLVGESGSGKSVTGFSIMGLIDEPGRIVGGSHLHDFPGSNDDIESGAAGGYANDRNPARA